MYIQASSQLQAALQENKKKKKKKNGGGKLNTQSQLAPRLPTTANESCYRDRRAIDCNGTHLTVQLE
jgi:hypothetical protein